MADEKQDYSQVRWSARDGTLIKAVSIYDHIDQPV